MSYLEESYPCVGVCLTDADSGYCLGCGRPPLSMPASDAHVSGQSGSEAEQDGRHKRSGVVNPPQPTPA